MLTLCRRLCCCCCSFCKRALSLYLSRSLSVYLSLHYGHPACSHFDQRNVLQNVATVVGPLMCADSDSPGSDVDCCCSRGSKAQRFKMAFQCTPTRARTQVHMYISACLCVYKCVCKCACIFCRFFSLSPLADTHTQTHTGCIYAADTRVSFGQCCATFLCHAEQTNKQTKRRTNKRNKQQQ